MDQRLVKLGRYFKQNYGLSPVLAIFQITLKHSKFAVIGLKFGVKWGLLLLLDTKYQSCNFYIAGFKAI